MASKSNSDSDPDPRAASYVGVPAFGASAYTYDYRRLIDNISAALGPPRASGRCQIIRQIDHALLELRKGGRCALHILDVGCEDGSWLIETALHASMLGFVAIDGRGFDGVPAMVDRARWTAQRIRDPRIGLCFEVADVAAALAEEDDHGADIVLCHYGMLAKLPANDHEHVVAELGRVTGGAFICLGGAQ